MKREFDFIQLNGSILDYSEYSKNVILLKNYLKHKIIELLLEEGFKLELEKNPQYHSLELRFYHKEKDLQLAFSVKKKGKELWV